MTTPNVPLVCRIFCLVLVNGLFGLVWSSDQPPARSQAPATRVLGSAFCPAESTRAAGCAGSFGWRDFADAYRSALRNVSAQITRSAIQARAARPVLQRPIPPPPEPGLGLDDAPIDLPAHSSLEALLVPAHDWSARLDLVASADRRWIPMEPHEMFAVAPTQDELRRERLLRKLAALASLTGEHAAQAAATARAAVESTIDLSVQWQHQAVRILREEELIESPTAEARADGEPVSRR